MMWALLAATVAVAIAFAAVTVARGELLAKTESPAPCCCHTSCHDTCPRKHA